METESEIRTRLERMVAEDPSGQEAMRLLACLTVFQDIFPRAAMIAVSQGEMDAAQRMNAFATLCRWRLVYKVSQRRYRLEETLRALLPPSDAVHRRALEYTLKRLKPGGTQHIYFYWHDMITSLAWAVHHWPDKIKEIDEKSILLVWPLHREWPFLRERLKSYPQNSDSISAIAASFEMIWTEDLFLEFCARTGQLGWHHLNSRAEAACINKDLPFARSLYERALEMTETIDILWVRIHVCTGLLNTLVLQNDLEALHVYHERFLPVMQRATRGLHALGLMMAQIGRKDTARSYFAQALRLVEMGNEQPYEHFCIYRNWARLEKNDGHLDAAMTLYRLALSHAMMNIESLVSMEHVPRIEWGWWILERLEREIRKLDAHISSQHS